MNMRKLNEFVYIKDEHFTFSCGEYIVEENLPAGEYYIWGDTVCYRYLRGDHHYKFSNDNEGYAIFEINDQVIIEEGVMTPVENIGYIRAEKELIVPKHIYRVGREIPLGFYLYKYDKGYFTETEFLNENECGVYLYSINMNSTRIRKNGEYGCVEITDKIKYITLKNGIAMYSSQFKFDEECILEDGIEFKNILYKEGQTLFSNKIIDMKLLYKYRKGGRFCGKLGINVIEYDWYVINGKYKWIGKVVPIFNQALKNMKIQFTNKNRTESICYVCDFQDYRYKYNSSKYKGYYVISTELPSELLGDELQLTLVNFNGLKVEEKLVDYVNTIDYMNEQELKKHYKNDFECLEDVLNQIECLDVEQELKWFREIPEMIKIVLPILKDIAMAQDKIGMIRDDGKVTFEVPATYNKGFYCIAKLADQAIEVHSKKRGNEFVVTYDKKILSV